MKTIKEEIKELAEKQVFLKSQRKTVKLVGERKMPSWEATYKAQLGKETLRHLNAAYRILRGKEPILPKRKELDMDYVNRLVEKFTVKEAA